MSTSDLSDERLAEWESDAEGWAPTVRDDRRILALIAEVRALRAKVSHKSDLAAENLRKVEAAEANRDVAHEYADQLEAECRRWKRKARKKDRDRKAAQAKRDEFRQALDTMIVAYRAVRVEHLRLRDGISANHTRVGLPEHHARARDIAPDRCRQCNVPWPCPTVTLLAPQAQDKPGIVHHCGGNVIGCRCAEWQHLSATAAEAMAALDAGNPALARAIADQAELDDPVQDKPEAGEG